MPRRLFLTGVGPAALPRNLFERPRAAARTDGGGIAAVVVVSAVFSLGAPIVRLLPLPAATVSFWRLVIGVSVLVAVALALRAPWPAKTATTLVAGLCFGVHQLLFNEASQTTSIAVVTLLGAAQPLLVALVSRRAVGEPVPRALIGWSLCALLGIGIVVQANLDAPTRSLMGDVLAGLQVVAFTAYFLAAKRGSEEGAPTLTFTAGTLITALLVVTPAMLLVADRMPAGGATWGLLALYALVPGNGHLLLTWSHRRVSAVLSSLILAAQPLLATVWAAWLFDEPFGWRHVLGMLLVVTAIAGGRTVERARTAPAAPVRPADAGLVQPLGTPRG